MQRICAALVFLFGVVGGMMQIAPEDAVSNVSKYIKPITGYDAPAWLASQNADLIVHHLSRGCLAVGLFWFSWPWMIAGWARLVSFSHSYRLQWPIAKRDIATWPRNAPLSSRLYHSRTWVDFSRLQRQHIIKVTLIGYSAANEDMELESVTGTLSYSGCEALPSANIVHEGGGNSLAALNEIQLRIDHYLSPEQVTAVNQAILLNKQISINLSGLRIVFRSTATGERSCLHLWEGVLCIKTEYPAVAGRTVTSFSGCPVATAATKLGA